MSTKKTQVSQLPTKAEQRCIIKHCKNEFESTVALSKQHNNVAVRLLQKHSFNKA